MSANTLLELVTWALYVLVFVSVLIEAVRRPLRSNVDIALFFGAVALIIAEALVVRALGTPAAPSLTALVASILMGLPYLLLRLVDDFSVVPRLFKRGAEAGLLASVVLLFAFAGDLPPPITLLMVGYFLIVTVYASVAFLRHGRRSTGVTKRRMYAVALGSGFLGLVLLIAGVQTVIPAGRDVWMLLSQAGGLASSICYVFGFAPPGLLRRAWQEPELRAFLARAASLPRLPDTIEIVRALEAGAAASLGAPDARIALWSEEEGMLNAVTWEGPGTERTSAPGQMVAGRVFASQRAVFWPNAAKADPDYAHVYQSTGAIAVLSAPITAGQKRLGVLTAFAPRAPIFGRDDLVLLQLLADQAAVILESRALFDEASRLRAREEANRLKDDFLSAAAHDLKTPLTTLMAQAQFLERRATTAPEAPPDLRGIQRMVTEAKRLSSLVLELLDASRVEQGRLVGSRHAVDLADVLRDVCRRERSPRHRCVLETDGSIVGELDRPRIEQLVENLIENAVKYSPAGGDTLIRLWREGDDAHLTVSDRGIGIPPGDLDHIFDRFQRGANVDDRRFAGMGLGLYICRGIAEQHGGRIWAESKPGEGSTFHVVLPLRAAVPAV